MQPPFPEGDVLWSRDGELYFYVVEPEAPSLGFAVSAPGIDGPVLETVSATEPLDVVVRPAEGPIDFTIETPEGLSDLELCTTTVMPGFILEEGCGESLAYRYDATALHEDFPNLDLFDADGFAGVDTITVSFFVSGTDEQGQRHHFARSVLLQGEELIAPSQEPTPDLPPPPPSDEYLTSEAVPGYRFQVRITNQQGIQIMGSAEPECIAETLCVSGAVAGRSEVFVRVVGPKPNGRMWPTVVRFSTSTIEVWVEQEATGEVRYYRLEGASSGVDDLTGLFDREGFTP